MSNFEDKQNNNIIPVVRSDIFENNKDSRFATVHIGRGISFGDRQSDLFDGYMKLRKNVYSSYEMINPDDMSGDGTDLDLDDIRSEHFVVAENREVGRVAIISCMRLICKVDDMPLPIENFYPEVFFENPIDKNSAEISRLISQGNGIANRVQCVRRLILAALKYSDDNNIGPGYAVMEEYWEKALNKFGVPSSRVAGAKRIEHYNNSENVGVKVESRDIHQSLGQIALGGSSIITLPVNFWGRKNE